MVSSVYSSIGDTDERWICCLDKKDIQGEQISKSTVLFGDTNSQAETCANWRQDLRRLKETAVVVHQSSKAKWKNLHVCGLKLLYLSNNNNLFAHSYMVLSTLICKYLYDFKLLIIIIPMKSYTFTNLF